MDKKKATVIFRVDAEYKIYLEKLAAHYEVTVSEFVRGILVDTLEECELPFYYNGDDE